MSGEIFHQTVNLLLSPDIDAPGGFVKEQHLGLQRQPFADDYLLLIAAGEKLHHLPVVRSLDAQRLDHLGTESLFAGGIAESAALVLAQAG